MRIILKFTKKVIYIIELTVGFESNINLNAERKKDKYMQLTRDLSIHNS